MAEQAYAEPLALGGALFQFLEVAQYWARGVTAVGIRRNVCGTATT
jgi:hypothetical protein